MNSTHVSALNETIELLYPLTEEQLKEIQEQAREFARKNNDPFRPKTEKEILAELDESRRLVELGYYKTAKELEKELLAEYAT